MQVIFKTGTFLTASNLNISQQASGLLGKIKGCDVINIENSKLSISEGIVKFNDGVIAKFDGTESISISDIASGKYYVCAIEYSNYSFAYSIVDTLPLEYEYVLLAEVTINNNQIDIVNYSKASSCKERIHFDLTNLNLYFDQEIKKDADGIKYINLVADNSQSSVQFSEKEFEFGFIALNDLSTINIRGNFIDTYNVSSDTTHIVLFLTINGEDSGLHYSLDESNFNETEGFSITLPSNKILKNDKCLIKLDLYNKSKEISYARIYGISIN